MGEGKWFRWSPGRLERGVRRREQGKRSHWAEFADHRRLRLEALEDRRMLATFTVTTLQDTVLNDDNERVPAAGSLRAAVEAAEANDEADIILFADNLAGAIGLNFGQIEITKPVRILGPSPQVITISAQGGNRIFHIESSNSEGRINVEISGVTLTNGSPQGGDDDRGGAIYSLENLRMTEVIVQGNSSPQGGGGVYQGRGSLTVSRSLFIGNSAAGEGGGAILNGTGGDNQSQDGPAPRTYVIDSTFTQNETNGDEAYGGALFNRFGTLEVYQSTIIGNSAALGGGIASYGNPVGEGDEDPPAPTNFTKIGSTIIWGNETTAEDGGTNLDEVGMTEGGEEEEPGPLEPSIESVGNNIIEDTSASETAMTDQLGVDPMVMSNDDGDPILVDVGGPTRVFLPVEGSPAIDMGGTPKSNFEQRGRHFKRAFSFDSPDDPVMDVGAAEVQAGQFVVDILLDESDTKYSAVGLGADPYTSGDFSLREALLFSEKNPEVDTVSFSQSLRAPDATISVTMGSLPVQQSVFIEGPETWILTINAFDPTPLVKNSDGTRVFTIDNGSVEDVSDVSISNLVISGGDFAGNGGGIFNRENLTLNALTIRNNGASLRGGAIYVQHGNLTIHGTTINNNRVGDDGAGIYIDGVGGAPAVTIINSTISGNTAADRGAGIANKDGTLVIKYSTITLNTSASTLASGIVNFGAAARTEIGSTIVSGNANNDLGFFLGANAATFASLGYNLIGNGTPGVLAPFSQPGDKINILNPMLDPLGITGGRIATHRPQAGSPAIDMGDPNAMVGQDDVPEFDQRGKGFARIYVDDDPETPDRIDIGAYELQPSMLVVDLAGDDDDGDYTTGRLTLREAINISNLNPLRDTIVFDIEKLGPAITVGGGSNLVITDSVTIIGPGSGTLALQAGDAGSIFVINDSTDDLLDVVISGLELRNAQTGAIVSNEDLDLDDLIFVNNDSATGGGALYHQTGNLQLRNSLLTGNSSTGLNADGGAVLLRNAQATLDFVTIAGNTVSQTGSDGAGLAVFNSTVVAREVTLSGNSIPAANSRGGGLFAENSSLTFANSVISGNLTVGSNSLGGGVAAVNSAIVINGGSLINLNSTFGSQAPGGAIHLDGGSLVVEDSQMAQNSTAGQMSSGGAVTVTHGGQATITRTVIMGNYVGGINSHGGALANLGGNLIVRDSLIANNQAQDSQAKGGGLYSDTNLTTQKTRIVNSTISGNSASLRGGGVFNADGLTEILHSTITNNASNFMNSGSGVASQANALTRTTVFSSIVAGNVGAAAFSPTGSDIDFVDGFVPSIVSLGYNLIGIGNSGAAFNQAGDIANSTDPLLGPLQDNTNDPTVAVPLLTHALLPGSPAINGGDPAFKAASYSPALNTDQRGDYFYRVGGGRIDIGAFESDGEPILPIDFNSDAVVDGADFLTWQRNFGNQSANRSKGDANGDNQVDGADLAEWTNGYGTIAAAATVSSSASSLVAIVESAQSAALLAEGEPSETLAVAADAKPSLPLVAFIASLTEAEPELLDEDAVVEDLGDEVLYLQTTNVDDGFAALDAATGDSPSRYAAVVAAGETDDAEVDEAVPEDAVFAALGTAL